MKILSSFRPVVQTIAAIMIGLALYSTPTVLKPLILATMLLCGAYYCGWICPFGFLQDLGSQLGKWLGIKRSNVPEPIHRTLIYGRYILALAAAFWISDTLFTLLSYEPRGAASGFLTGEMPSIAVLAVLMIFLAISVMYERPYCRYFCIEGAKYGMASLFRIFTVRRNTHICVQCGKCDNACPMQIQITKVENLRSPQCINCLECVEACPVDGALSYGMVTGKGSSNHQKSA